MENQMEKKLENADVWLYRDYPPQIIKILP